MKLWEKNYVLTITLVLFILYGSLFFILNNSFQTNFSQIYDSTLQTKQSLASSLETMIHIDGKHEKLRLYCQAMENQDILVAVSCDGEMLVNFLPVEIDSDKIPTNQLIEANHHRYLYLSEVLIDQDTEVILHYMRPMDDFYKAFHRQICFFLIAGILISALLSCILYFAIKKMYHPINNIAHELRTPLTAIQGYAQYILLGKVSPEDILFASGQIHQEAQYINEIINRLLAMDYIRNEKLHMEKIDWKDFFETLKTHYPSIILKNEMPYLTGDRTLLLCLFMNLISNISRSGGQVIITALDNKICIFNQEDFIEHELLPMLNKNRSIPKEKIHGKGLGVPLCHEIVKLHHGTLRYESSKADGTTVTITFLKEKRKLSS